MDGHAGTQNETLVEGLDREFRLPLGFPLQKASTKHNDPSCFVCARLTESHLCEKLPAHMLDSSGHFCGSVREECGLEP
jgi:hypothetical protein